MVASYSSTHEGQKLGAQVGSSASDIANDISGGMKRATGMEGTAESLQRQGREAAENAQAVAGNIRTALDKSIQDQPMTTLLMAVGVGFLIGALWRS